MMQGLTTVREARERAGLTQQALAHRAGISLRTLARIEAGADCNVGTLARIASALDVPPATLLAEPAEAAS